MRSELLPISALSAHDLAAWEELGRASIVPNPYQEPSFVLPAAQGWEVTDLQLLIVRDDQRWLAALPVRALSSWRGVPGRTLAAWRHLYCYLGNPLVAADRPELVLAELLRHGLTNAPVLGLDWVDADGPLAEALTSALNDAGRPVDLGGFERAALHRREAADYLERAINGHHRNEYRRKRKRLEAEIGPVTLRDQTDDPTAVERFLALESAGWKGKQGTALASRPEHRTFFIAMADAFGRSGRFQMLALASDTETVAMRCDLLGGEMSFNFKIAFNERLGRFSPGIQLYIDNLERFHSSGLSRSDSCADAGNATLNRIWVDRRRLRNVVVARPGPAGLLSFAKWRGAVEAAPLRDKVAPIRADLRKALTKRTS